MRKTIFGVYSFDVNRLTNRPFYQFGVEVLDLVNPVVKSYRSETFLTSQATKLAPLLQSLEAEMHKTQKGQVADKLKEADQRRDDGIDVLIGVVKALAKFNDSAMQAASQKLLELFGQYKGIKKEPYQLETESINHLLKALAKADYQPAVERLNLAPYIEQLRQSQAAFDRLYKDRQTEKTQKVIGKTQEIRDEAGLVLELILTHVGVLATGDSSKTYMVTLREQLNTVIKNYAKPKRKAKDKESAADEEVDDRPTTSPDEE